MLGLKLICINKRRLCLFIYYEFYDRPYTDYCFKLARLANAGRILLGGYSHMKWAWNLTTSLRIFILSIFNATNDRPLISITTGIKSKQTVITLSLLSLRKFENNFRKYNICLHLVDWVFPRCLCQPRLMSPYVPFGHKELSKQLDRWEIVSSLRWRHNGCDSVSNHQPRECLLRRLIRRTSKKTSKLRVTGLCARNSPETGQFPAQMASNAENVSIWWRHHDSQTSDYRKD